MGNCFGEAGASQNLVQNFEQAQLEKAVVAQRGPYPVDMKQGQEYYWCSCGKSQNQPFCDGAHKGSTFVPVKGVWDKEDGKAYFCGCKKTKVFCDGTHNDKTLDW